MVDFIRMMLLSMAILTGSVLALVMAGLGIFIYRVDARIPTAAEIAAHEYPCTDSSEKCLSPAGIVSLPKHIVNAFSAAARRRPIEVCGLCGYAPWLPDNTMTTYVARHLIQTKMPRTGMFDWHANVAVMTIKVQRVLPPERIMQIYLNDTCFGKGARGIKAAAAQYFSKKPSDLSISEAAYLAGLLKSPERYLSDPDRALERRNWVIDEMAAQGHLEPEAAARARDTPLHVNSRID